MPVVVECPCGNVVKRKASRPGRYCSHPCYWKFAEKTAWNKGLTGIPSGRKGHKFGPMSDANKRAISEGWKNRADKTRKRLYPSGENHPMWKGGVTPENDTLRKKFRRTMQKQIFERDDYTCGTCRKRGGYLQVDHIKSWADHPDLRFSAENCKTVCMACHYFKTFGKPLPSGVIWGHNFSKKGRVVT